MADRIRVLHVDDEPDTREVTAEGLERVADQIDVTSVATAEDAFEHLYDEPVDCVLSDYRLPGADGLEFLAQVRDRRPKLPFVLYTARGSEEVASEALSEGATEYVQKGSSTEHFERLAQQIIAAIEQQQASESERIAALVRDIQSDLVRARTRGEVETRVCDRLVGADQYLFAWIGTVDVARGRVKPQAAAGPEAGYLDTVEIGIDDSPTGQGPAGQAVETRETHVVHDIAEDQADSSWREDALERGYRSSAAVPIEYDGTLYGVLNVCAGHPNAFDASEQALLEDLCEAVAHAYYRMQIQDQYESQYQELFEDAPVMMAFTREENGEPIIEDCNRRFANKLGYEPADVRDLPLAELYTDESADQLLEEGGYQRSLDGGFSPREREFVTADGDRLVTLLQASPRRNKEGEVIGTRALYVDITDRKRAQSVLERAEAMEASMDGIAILDEDDKFVYMNQAQADMFGYDDPEALLGETWRVLNEDDEIEWFEEEIEPILAETGEWRGEITGVRADGTTFPRELSVTRLEDGSRVAVVRDITDRREREQKLQQFQKAVERTAHVVYITDTDGTIEYVNPAFEEVTGFSKSDAVGQTPRILNSGEYSDEYYAEFWETILAGDQWEAEMIDRRADGEEIVLTQTISPITDENGDVQKFVAVGQDITRRKEYERTLEEQRNNLEILNQVVRHDIRNDLQVVLAFAETLDSHVQAGGQEYIDRVLDAASDAVDITTTARDVTEVMLQSDVDHRPIPLRSTLEAEIDEVRTKHDHALVRLDGSIPGVYVRADDMLESVFRNLLSNAIQHNDKPVPQVTVSVAAVDDTVVVRIADNGPGIPDDRKAEIFEQGEMSLDSDGTGLGLYLVDTLVGRYGGDVRVEDNDPDGAVFIVELPIADRG
jgi:PAS domain S-box-containing protein